MLTIALALCVSCADNPNAPPLLTAADSATTQENPGDQATTDPDSKTANTPTGDKKKPTELTSNEARTDTEATSASPDTKSLVSTNLESESETEPPPPPPTAPKPRRIIFLGSQSPLVVDLYITQGDRSIDEIVQQSAQKMLSDADENEDGVTSWEEIAGSYSGMSEGMLGDLPRGRDRRMLFRSYDSNANGSVDEDEFIRYYNRGQAGIDWLVLRTTFNVARTEIATPLGRWLDANGNGKLEPREIESAATRIRMKDGNDDGVLQVSEIRETRRGMQFNVNQQTATPLNRIPAFVVADDTEWSELLYRLQRKYTFGAPLLVEDTARWPAAFQELDDDDDGTIWDNELALLADRPADLSVTYRLPMMDAIHNLFEGEESDKSDQSDPPVPGNVSVSPGNDVATEPSTTQGVAVPVETSAGTLIFALADNYFDGEYGQQLQLGFDRLDQDDDDALSESEFVFLAQALRLSFDEIDTDDDDKVSREELKAGFDPASRAITVRVELWMLPQDDPIMTALDQDHNGQLGTAEIQDCANRLAELDTDQDGIVQSSETDFGMYVVLRNAAAATANAPPTPAQIQDVTPQDQPEFPAWFRAMDGNQDGLIGRSEFLDEMALFESLDQDKNGSLTLSESESQ